MRKLELKEDHTTTPLTFYLHWVPEPANQLEPENSSSHPSIHDTGTPITFSPPILQFLLVRQAHRKNLDIALFQGLGEFSDSSGHILGLVLPFWVCLLRLQTGYLIHHWPHCRWLLCHRYRSHLFPCISWSQNLPDGWQTKGNCYEVSNTRLSPDNQITNLALSLSTLLVAWFPRLTGESDQYYFKIRCLNITGTYLHGSYLMYLQQYPSSHLSFSSQAMQLGLVSKFLTCSGSGVFEGLAPFLQGSINVHPE